jgi:hypothetical protein
MSHRGRYLGRPLLQVAEVEAAPQIAPVAGPGPVDPLLHGARDVVRQAELGQQRVMNVPHPPGAA